MRVCEIFKSIQGEGTFLGSPSIFLRLSLCNLRCQWCDSKYSYDVGKEMGVDEVLLDIASMDCTHLVITGGEPLLQQDELIKLVGLLPNFMTVEIETNGTIKPNIELMNIIDTVNVSPKLASSGVKLCKRITSAFHTIAKMSSIEDFIYPEIYFKFVIAHKRDFLEMSDLIVEHNIKRNRILLMPEGTEREAVIENSKWLIELCKEHKFTFSPRLHIMLYGMKRGV